MDGHAAEDPDEIESENTPPDEIDPAELLEEIDDLLEEIPTDEGVVTDPTTCPYLPDERMSLEYQVHYGLEAETFEHWLSRGWRKQGMSFFRPACQTCRECRSIRIPVDKFRPTKSQRKALRKNEGIRLEVRPASITEDHMRIYRAYHLEQAETKGWPLGSLTPGQYKMSFLAGDFPFTRDFLYYEEDRLVGVGLVDVLPNALSSVYFYHDPEWRPRSPGTFTILKEIEFARVTGRKWVYLGYWVSGCASMTYKSKFGPHELLNEYPTPDEIAEWRSADDQV